MKLKIRERLPEALIKSIKVIVLSILLWFMLDTFCAALSAKVIYARLGILIAILISMITLCFLLFDEVYKK